jgi:hypothetical protein
MLFLTFLQVCKGLKEAMGEEESGKKRARGRYVLRYGERKIQ